MVFGIELQPQWIVFGGVFLAVLLTFQILQGMRIIRFKGPLFMKVHRAMAWVVAGSALVHAFLGLAYFQDWRIF